MRCGLKGAQRRGGCCWLVFLAVLLGCRASKPGSAGPLDALFAEAKRSGRLSVSLPSPRVDRPVIRSVDGLNNERDAILVAYPVSSAVVINDRRDDLISYYKLRILRDLSRVPLLSLNLHHAAAVPPDLLPLAPDEIVVGERGGSLVVDGVEVFSGDDPRPLFRQGSQYLLFVAGWENRSQTGYLPIGRTAFFAIAADGTSLLPVYTDPRDAIQADVRTRFHGSLPELEKYLSTQR